MQLEYFPVIHPDGRIVEVHVQPKDLYDSIVEHVGSPFDYAQITETFGAYLHDEGLLNGMPLNIPMALVYGIPICGPMLLGGAVDRNGKTTYPKFREEEFEAITTTASRLHEVVLEVEYRRERPFTITILKPGQDLADLLGGDGS